MVGQSLWKNLKNLVTLDQKIRQIDSETKHIEKILKKEHQDIPKLEELLKQHENTYLAGKKNVSQQEITAKELRDKETHDKNRLEKSTNPKEYKALEKELKAITQKRMLQDDLLIKAWHELECSEKKLQLKKEEIFEKIKQLKEGITNQQESLKDHVANKESLLTNRKEMLKLIPNEWLDKYKRMINKVPDPIVPVLNESCSSCYYAILRQDLMILKKSGVLPCRSCYRFLYYDEQEEVKPEVKPEKEEVKDK